MIIDALADVVAHHHDRTAVIDQRGRSVRFAELWEATAGAAATFEQMGIGVGSRIGLFEPNRIEWLVAALAAAKLGATVIALNTRFRSAELDYLLGVASIETLVAPDAFLGVDPPSLFAAIDRPLRVVVDGEPARFGERFSPSSWAAAERGPVAGSPVPATDHSATDHTATDWVGFTTSGTTGHPKLAVHSQAGTLHHLQAVIAGFGLGTDSVAYVPLPLCGVFGFTTAMATILAGGTAILHETFDPRAAADAIVEHGVTFANGADDMLAAIFDTGLIGTDTTWTTGVFADFTNTGAQVARRAETITDGRLRLSGVYGSSEGFALMSRWPSEWPVAQRTANGGRCVSPALSVRCADPETGTVIDHGVPGELQFRGPGMIDRYLEHPDHPETAAANQRAFTTDGWFRSGDLGHTVDEDSFVYAARLGDSLRLRGFLCDPSEIEHHLETHPSVELAQVVGVDRPTGQEAIAFVRLARTSAPEPATAGNQQQTEQQQTQQQQTEQQLQEHCRQGLANYKRPARIVIVDEFPVTDGPNGIKIRKVDLRTMAADLFSPS